MNSYIVEIILTNGGGIMKNNKFMLFVKQNGFLLFLFICVCVVAAGTIFIATQDTRTSENVKEEDLVILEEVKDVNEEIPLEDIEVSAIEEPKGEVSELLPETAEAVAEETVTSEVVTSEPVEQAINEEELEYVDDYEEEEDDAEFVIDKPVGIILPISGDILTEFTNDKLVYSSTLDEWRSHDGIDIKSSIGTKVMSPQDGTIKEVIEDDLWGITVVIDHGNGLVSKLSNLATLEMVKPGISVVKGDYIGAVGKSANIEMAMEPHLHFEVTKDGKIIDPRSINN